MRPQSWLPRAEPRLPAEGATSVSVVFVNLTEAQREQVTELYEHAMKKAIECA